MDRIQAPQDQPSTQGRDVLGWAALTAALVVTMSAEYQLGIHAGYGPWLAAGIPASLDVYALRAFRLRRDVGLVVVVLIVVNALSHLVSAGLLPINIPLVVAVSAIAPLVFWRVHQLRHDTADAHQEAPQQAAGKPAPGAQQVAQELGQDIAQDGSPQPTVERPVTAQDAAPAAAQEAPSKPPSKPPSKALSKPPKKAPSKRRSQDEWVEIATPIFRAEWASRGRPPSDSEFAKAITAAGYGKRSASTANTIKKAILDRAAKDMKEQVDER